MGIETPVTTTLFQGWFLRIFLLLAAVMGFLGVATTTSHRLNVTVMGVAGEMSAASLRQTLPVHWLATDVGPKADFTVQIRSTGNRSQTTMIHLRRDVVEALLRGETRRLTYEEGNPRNYLLVGEAPPPFGLGWLFLGLAFLAVFLYSLRLR